MSLQEGKYKIPSELWRGFSEWAICKTEGNRNVLMDVTEEAETFLDCVQWQSSLFSVSELRNGIVMIVMQINSFKSTHPRMIDTFLLFHRFSQGLCRE